MKTMVLLLSVLVLCSCSQNERDDSFAQMPSRYDLRDYQLVSTVKTQIGTKPDGTSDLGKSVGLCWAFSSLASLESNMLKQGIAGHPQSPEANLSPWYIGNYIGFNLPYYEFNHDAYPGVTPTLTLGYYAHGYGWGGGGACAAWIGDYLISGKSLPLDQDFPMPIGDMNAQKTLTPPAQIGGNQYMLRGMPIYSADDFINQNEYRNALKNHIYNHGALQSFVHMEPIDYEGIESQLTGTVLFEGNRFMDKENFNMFTYELDNLYTDLFTHAIAIVGWNDNRKISVRGHSTVGAWLIKDSIGDKNWDEGYFWVAYDDPVANVIAFGMIACPSGIYQHPSRYQTHPGALSKIAYGRRGKEFDVYDFGSIGYLLNGNLNQDSWAFTEFTLDNPEQLAAIGIFTANRTEDLTLKIFKNSLNSTPILTRNYTLKYMGYHLLELDSEISFVAGETIVIGVGFKSSNSPNQRLPLVYVQNDAYDFQYTTKFGTSDGDDYSLTPYSSIGNCSYFMQAVMR